MRFKQFLIQITSIAFWGLIGLSAGLAAEQPPKQPVYTPLPLTLGQDLTDTLSDRDIPTGQAGDQIAVDLVSEVFDPMVILMTKEGIPIAENDDGPDGTPNSLLFMRIVKSGVYIIRVRSFGETTGGAFKLTVTPLKSRL
jgi:hypothetical protein